MSLGTDALDGSVTKDAGLADSGKAIDTGFPPDTGDDKCGPDAVRFEGRLEVGVPMGVQPGGERLLVYENLFERVGARFADEQGLCLPTVQQPDNFLAECSTDRCDICVPKGKLIDVVPCSSVRTDPGSEYLSGFVRWGEDCRGSYRCSLESRGSLRVAAEFEFGSLLLWPFDKPPSDRFPLVPEVARVLPLHGDGSLGWEEDGAATINSNTQGAKIPDGRPSEDGAPFLSGEALVVCAHVLLGNTPSGIGTRTLFGKGTRGPLEDLFAKSSYAAWFATEGANRRTYFRASLFQASDDGTTRPDPLVVGADLLRVKEGEWTQACLYYDGSRLFAGVGSPTFGVQLAAHDVATLLNITGGQELDPLPRRKINPTPDSPLQVGMCSECPFSSGALGLSGLVGRVDFMRAWPFTMEPEKVIRVLQQPRPND